MMDDKYSHDYFARQIHVIKKWALNLAAVYVVLFIVVDLYRYSGIFLQQALIARFYLMLIPLLVLLTVFYNQKKLNINTQQFEWLCMILVIFVAVGHTKIIEIAAHNNLFFPRIGLTIVLVYSGLLLALSLSKAVFSSVVIIIIATLTYLRTGMPPKEVASLLFFYLVFSSCCVFMNKVFNGILYANHSLIKVIDQQANSDYLTKLFNRRYFYMQSKRSFKQAIRDKKPLALLLVDLDNFKTINDQFGHKSGDEVLVKVGKILKNHCRRPLDVVARLGGDEFVMLLHNANIKHIEQVGDSIIRDINQIKITAHNITNQIPLGCSIGGAFKAIHSNTNLNELMSIADQALYQVKTLGKNHHLIKTLFDDIDDVEFAKDQLKSV